MEAIRYKADEGKVWVKKTNLTWELGDTIYLAPKDSIDNYEQVVPQPLETEEGEE